jgi:ubiquinone/menaquinone biosynthesis C-methylase UbiE/rhodanese-related sulfurtransferase
MSATMTDERWNEVVDVAEEFSLLLGPANDKFLELGKLFPGARVLDLGCGTGPLSRSAAALVGDRGRVVGIDRSEAMIAAAKERAPGPANLQFFAHDAHELRFKEGTCDVIYSQLGFDSFANPLQVARRCRSLLRPGGRIAVMVLGERDHNQFVTAAGASVSQYAEKAFGLAKPESVRKLLEVAGFQDVKAKEIRALVTVHDRGSWWAALRSLLGISEREPPADLPRVPHCSLSIVMALGMVPPEGAPDVQPLRPLAEVVAQARARIRELSPYEVDKNLGKRAILVDVREPEEWSQGIIKNALRIPRGELELRLPRELAEKRGEIVVYCQDGSIGALAAARLEDWGYSSVWNLAGGFSAWMQDRMPISKPPFK